MVGHLMNDFGSKFTGFVGAENGRVVHGIQATARCLVRVLDALFRFGIDDTERNGVEMSTHAVHAESD